MHTIKRRGIPIPERLVKQRSFLKHVVHVCDIGNIPPSDIFIKSKPLLESIRHIGYRSDIPISNVPVGGSGIHFFGKPHIDRVLKIRVG